MLYNRKKKKVQHTRSKYIKIMAIKLIYIPNQVLNEKYFTLFNMYKKKDMKT